MDDYIKRGYAKNAICSSCANPCSLVEKANSPCVTIIELARIPSADVVPVVRCKDCKYWDKDTLRHNSNDVAEWDECECEMLANRDRWNEIDRYCCDIHFCADGERNDDED